MPKDQMLMTVCASLVLPPLVSFHDLILAENARSVPTFLSGLKYRVFSSGRTAPNSKPGIYNFYYFWKACLKSRKCLRETSWEVAVERSF